MDLTLSTARMNTRNPIQQGGRIMKKKRKFYLCTVFEDNAKTETTNNNKLQRIPAKMLNLTAKRAAATVVNDDSRNTDNLKSICLTCRQQHEAEKSIRCCQHLTTTMTDNDYSSKHSLSNCRTVAEVYNCIYYCSHSANVTATTTCNSTSCWQHSSCAASLLNVTSTNITLLSSQSQSRQTNQIVMSKVCSCRGLETTTTTRTTSLSSDTVVGSTTATTALSSIQNLKSSPLLFSSSVTPSAKSSSKPVTNATDMSHYDIHNNNHTHTQIDHASCKNTTCSNSANKSCVLFQNALRTFQIVFLFIQMQLLQLILNNSNNKSNNNIYKRQPLPPLSRLKFRRNSYSNNYFNNATNIFNASQHHRHHQNHHKQQQQQAQHHCERLQQRHFGYFKMSNLSPLYIILIVLSFLSLFLPSTYAQMSRISSLASSSSSQVTLSRNETVCKSLDLRNAPYNFHQLENCTVIEGFLLITLVNTLTENEFTETYPLLTEVTEFIMIYRVQYLRSLSQIFPNLSIIRGRALFEGYALVVYFNPHLEDLGLSKLTTISRGGVRIESNGKLCFVETIDWTQIISNATDTIIRNNRATFECPLCPGDTKMAGSSSTDNELGCKEFHGRRHCWNFKSCQKICPEHCPNNCIDENTCCNESCLGGCSAENLNVCTSCRHFSIHNYTCTDKCPYDYYSYLDRRCITADSCGRIGTKFENTKQETLVPYNGVCSTRCPDGYNKVNLTCQKCGDMCIKKCEGGFIDSVTRAKAFHGCTHVTDLTISIARGGSHLMDDLEFGLSSIRVITGFLKVHRTFGMFSLDYFKNLKTIEGDKLLENKFALYVLENNDLQSLWGPNQTVRIENGRVFFHFNPKLCYTVIDALRPMLKNNATFDKNEVATDSNGSKGSCNTEFLNATVSKLTYSQAYVDINKPIKFDDERTFIGYQYFHIEDPHKNATKDHRPCYDGWHASEPTKDIHHIFNGLEPYTLYAYYVKTMTISSEPRNAQSPIQYFKTKAAQPKLVRSISAYANSSSEIIITWQPPSQANGKLIRYIVRAKLDITGTMEIKSRNYCQDPLKEAAKTDNSGNWKPVTETPEVPVDCKCNKEKNEFYEDDDAEASRHEKIDFENAVHNFVYVKQTTNETQSSSRIEEELGSLDIQNENRRRRRRSQDLPRDSFLMRHMRSPDRTLDEEEEEETSSVHDDSVLLRHYAILAKNETQLDMKGEHYVNFTAIVNVSTTEYVFRNLKHFSTYSLSVVACRQPEKGAPDEECSDGTFLHLRTQYLENVDKVENLQVLRETNSNTSRSSIRLRWDPPEHPNGAIVSYTISYMTLTQDALEEKKCITEQSYSNLTNGYLLTNLHTGNYSIRVRANSLAGEGVYTDLVYIDIPPTQISSTVIAIICICVIILLILILAVFHYLRKKILAPPSDLKIFPTVNPYYISLQYIPDDWEVARERVLQLSPLGQGSFGMVYEGILKGYNNSTDDTPCAIKTVNENATDRERMNFLNEASVMKQFDTYHVVRLLGVCSRGQPALVVMELMKNGDLKSYLRAHRPDEKDDGGLGMSDGVSFQPPPLSRIYQMAIEIADGMAYLAAKKYVHRDLAARNCMVASDLTVKIGDFGMTRDIYETDYYRKGTKGLLPVRWMPPESLRDGVYSSASDVFSYGVVLWEMATLASQPYQGFSNDQVLRYVIDGGVMERPENCTDKLYCLMQRCWHHRPLARPSFMEIIRYLMDMADPYFRDVSFFHSEEGQQVCNKEKNEHMQHSGDLFNDHDNDLDDVTTPLRVSEFNDYKLNMDNNSSVENHGDSPTVIDDDLPPHPRSPYSLGSAIIISSTPDGQSKKSFNLSQMSHNNPTLSSVPSTSAGVISGHLQHPHQRPQPPHQPFHGRYRHHQNHRHADDAEVYVQPDFEDDAEEVTGKSIETDERGYEVYDPSPNYREHGVYDDDTEGDFKRSARRAGLDKQRGGMHHLLPRQKPAARVPIIMPMSSSVPDEVISASATTTTAGKYPSLKKAVTETVQNVGNSLMPTRLRNINRRFFNHKRSGSNASHKSTSSNPNTTSSNSNTNLTSGSSGGGGKSMSGQNLGTIESGGSGSAGSYCATPRFFTPAAVSTSDNPNYQLLDETNASYVTDPITAPTSSVGFATSTNPNYQLLDESINTTADLSTRPPVNTSENPNYELMQAMNASDNPNYVLMNAPPQSTESFDIDTPSRISENPNYQMMGTPPAAANLPVRSSSPKSYSTQREQFPDSSGTSSEDGQGDDEHTEHIKMERIPLSRQRRNSERVQPKSRNSRSRSQSQHKSDERSKTPPNPSINTQTGPNTTKPTTTFSLKEKWLRQQQAKSSPPPPNGFIGREA